jgi:hypothetical protein
MSYEHQADGKDSIPLGNETSRDASGAAAPSNFQSALFQMIESAAQNPGELRRVVYEVARANLRREIWRRKPSLTAIEVQECMLALETAISRVEADSARGEYANISLPRLEIYSTWLDPELLNMQVTNEDASPSNDIVTSSELQANGSLMPGGLGKGFVPSRVEAMAPQAQPTLVRSGLAGAERVDKQPVRPEIYPEHPEAEEHFDKRPQHIEDDVRTSGDGASEWDEPRTGGSVVIPRGSREQLVRQTNSRQSEPILWPQPLPADRVGARVSGPQIEIVYPEREDPRSSRMRRRIWLWFIAWPIIALAGPGAFVVLYLGLAGRSDVPTAQTKAPLLHPVVAPGAPSLPLPTNYGVYAISNGALSELQALPIRAPDARVPLSAEIKSPSSALLPDGNIVFVLFRRDLVNSAPQKLAVRIVARVVRATTLNSGKVVSRELEGSWRIRNNSYDFKVSPLDDNREMVIARAETTNFVFPAGRYALVFGNLAYDFTVAGPITAPSQCVENFETLNGPIFSECRPK